MTIGVCGTIFSKCHSSVTAQFWVILPHFLMCFLRLQCNVGVSSS